MSKQEEIWEELAKRRYYDGWSSVGGNIPKWEDRTDVEREHFRKKIDGDFQYLHSQGVVIKINRKMAKTRLTDRRDIHECSGTI